MSFLGYILILVAGILGWFAVHPYILLPVAVIATLNFKYARKQSVAKARIKAGLALDLVYLFALQVLILFSAFGLGYFFSTSASSVPGV